MSDYAAYRAARIEDAEWIIGTDTPDRVARRLGYANALSLAAQLNKWGRRDLTGRLLGIERDVAA